jgi:hypothetical protein
VEGAYCGGGLCDGDISSECGWVMALSLTVGCSFGRLHKGLGRSWAVTNLFCMLCVGTSEETLTTDVLWNTI